MAQKKLSEIQDVHEEIAREAKVKAVQEVRVIAEMGIGDVVRQGDIYIHRVEADYLKGKESSTRQLAMGDTAGSRHVAELPARVFEGRTPPSWCHPATFLGPCIVSPERFTVTHPEHAHFSLPAGTFQVTHQLDGRTLKRAID